MPILLATSVPISDDDALRVSALRALEIIGTPGSSSFDAVVKLAADIFACPIAFYLAPR